MHIVIAVVRRVYRPFSFAALEVRIRVFNLRVTLRMQTIEQRFQFRVIQK